MKSRPDGETRDSFLTILFTTIHLRIIFSFIAQAYESVAQPSISWQTRS